MEEMKTGTKDGVGPWIPEEEAEKEAEIRRDPKAKDVTKVDTEAKAEREARVVIGARAAIGLLMMEVDITEEIIQEIGIDTITTEEERVRKTLPDFIAPSRILKIANRWSSLTA